METYVFELRSYCALLCYLRTPIADCLSMPSNKSCVARQGTCFGQTEAAANFRCHQ